MNDLKYDLNDAGTANIHVVILVIYQNYDINMIETANLAKSRELYRISCHSPELRYKSLICIVILVNDRNYNVNDAVTASIHVMVPVIDRDYDTNNIVKANLTKSQE